MFLFLEITSCALPFAGPSQINLHLIVQNQNVLFHEVLERAYGRLDALFSFELHVLFVVFAVRFEKTEFWVARGLPSLCPGIVVGRVVLCNLDVADGGQGIRQLLELWRSGLRRLAPRGVKTSSSCVYIVLRGYEVSIIEIKRYFIYSFVFLILCLYR